MENFFYFCSLENAIFVTVNTKEISWKHTQKNSLTRGTGRTVSQHGWKTMEAKISHFAYVGKMKIDWPKGNLEKRKKTFARI